MSGRKVIRKGTDVSMIATRTDKISGKIVAEESASIPIPGVLECAEDRGSVSYGRREVINTGDFETTTIEISVTLPIGTVVTTPEIKKAMEKARSFVCNAIEGETEEIRNEVDKGMC